MQKIILKHMPYDIIGKSYQDHSYLTNIQLFQRCSIKSEDLRDFLEK